jgi:hypothetical protein
VEYGVASRMKRTMDGRVSGVDPAVLAPSLRELFAE